MYDKLNDILFVVPLSLNIFKDLGAIEVLQLLLCIVTYTQRLEYSGKVKSCCTEMLCSKVLGVY